LEAFDKLNKSAVTAYNWLLLRSTCLVPPGVWCIVIFKVSSILFFCSSIPTLWLSTPKNPCNHYIFIVSPVISNFHHALFNSLLF
jgi:hypothetical protein